jgi:hypothetical protein
MASDDVDRSNMGEGRYANYAEIGHNVYEFIFDFGQFWLDATPPRVCVRIITSPETAHRIYDALETALAQYHNAFGDIRQEAQPETRRTP